MAQRRVVVQGIGQNSVRTSIASGHISMMKRYKKPPDRILDVPFPIPVLEHRRDGKTRILTRMERIPVLLRGIHRSDLEQRAACLVRYERRLWSNAPEFNYMKTGAVHAYIQGKGASRTYYRRLGYDIPMNLIRASYFEAYAPSRSSVVRDELGDLAAARVRRIFGDMFFEGAVFYRARIPDISAPGCPVRVTPEVWRVIHSLPIMLYGIAIEAMATPQGVEALRPLMAELETTALLGLVEGASGNSYADTANLLLRAAGMLSTVHPRESQRILMRATVLDIQRNAAELLDINRITPTDDLESLACLSF